MFNLQAMAVMSFGLHALVCALDLCSIVCLSVSLYETCAISFVVYMSELKVNIEIR